MKSSIRILFILVAFSSALYLTPSSDLLANDGANPEESASDTSTLEPGARNELSIKGVPCGFRWIPAGTFTMGSPKEEEFRDDNETQFSVTLTQGFWLLETEVTQRLWQAVMGKNPSKFIGDELPVEQVSWDDCQKFTAKINALGIAPSGWTFSLPTEAQWEYACRAGAETPFSFGPSLSGAQANFFAPLPYGEGSEGKALKSSAPVKSYSPNAWGLYDMHGNVWEWTADRYGDYPSESAIDPVGPNTGSERVLRGGGWNVSARLCRAARRAYAKPSDRTDHMGFRIVLVRL